jgi:branched-chain amino acid aminotransferase
MLQKFNPKNSDLKIFVGEQLHDRDNARISVFDSSVQGGDAVWEGLRVYEGRKIFCLQKHLDRLFASAHALAFKNVPDEGFIRQAIWETLEANGMDDDTHIRLTLTRGEKITSGMDPRLNQKGCCLIVLAEWKSPVYEDAASGSGMRLISSSTRRNAPGYLDSKIHHNNLLNNILAKIEANVAGADDALMLDQEGFVAETNATNFFLIKSGKLKTPFADACLPGVTRSIVMQRCQELGISFSEARISLSECYTADECFVTGTMGELSRVAEIDGRKIGELVHQGSKLLLHQLQDDFRLYSRAHAEQILI